MADRHGGFKVGDQVRSTGGSPDNFGRVGVIYEASPDTSILWVRFDGSRTSTNGHDIGCYFPRELKHHTPESRLLKKGDKVRRINKDLAGIKIGDICIVASDQKHADGVFRLQGYAGLYQPNNFELVTEEPHVADTKTHKFKVGDRVRRVANRPHRGLEKGDIATVEKLTNFNEIVVRRENGALVTGCDADRFELVTDALKVDDWVKVLTEKSRGMNTNVKGTTGKISRLDTFEGKTCYVVNGNFYHAEDLELLPPPAAVAYRIGDRVKTPGGYGAVIANPCDDRYTVHYENNNVDVVWRVCDLSPAPFAPGDWVEVVADPEYVHWAVGGYRDRMVGFRYQIDNLHTGTKNADPYVIVTKDGRFLFRAQALRAVPAPCFDAKDFKVGDRVEVNGVLSRTRPNGRTLPIPTKESITCIVHPIAKHPSVAPGEPRDDSDYCMACKGSGEVIVLCQDGIDPQDAYEAPMTCPECDGTGVGMRGTVVGTFATPNPGYVKRNADTDNDISVQLDGFIDTPGMAPSYCFDLVEGNRNTTATPVSLSSITPKEPIMSLAPVKIEARTFILLPGYSAAVEAKTLSDDDLLETITKAEAEIERLKKISAAPKLIAKRITALEEGITAVVALLDERTVEADAASKAKKSK